MTVQYVRSPSGERIREGLAAAAGARIGSVRTIRLLTQVQMAAFLGISQGAYSRFERGLDYPSRQQRAKLAEGLGVDVAWIERGGRLDKKSLLPAHRPGLFVTPPELCAFRSSLREWNKIRAAENYAIEASRRAKRNDLRAQRAAALPAHHRHSD